MHTSTLQMFISKILGVINGPNFKKDCGDFAIDESKCSDWHVRDDNQQAWFGKIFAGIREMITTSDVKAWHLLGSLFGVQYYYGLISYGDDVYSATYSWPTENVTHEDYRNDHFAIFFYNEADNFTAVNISISSDDHLIYIRFDDKNDINHFSTLEAITTPTN